MSVRPTETTSPSTASSTELPGLGHSFLHRNRRDDRFGGLGERIIQELCRGAARVTAPFIYWTASMNIFGAPALSACCRRTLLSHDAFVTHTIPQHLSSPLSDRGRPLAEWKRRRFERRAGGHAGRVVPPACHPRPPHRFSPWVEAAPGACMSMLSLLNALTQTATNAPGHEDAVGRLASPHALMKRTDRLKSSKRSRRICARNPQSPDLYQDLHSTRP